jgi:molybdate transport system permease protein
VARTRSLWFALVLALATAVTLSFLFLPVLAIFVNTDVGQLVSSLGNSESTDALRLSLETTAIAVAVIAVVGTPAAYALATRSFRGKAVVVTVVELPLVLPPAVAGIALLAAFGPNGILGPALKDAHVTLVFQTAGVVVAQVFVASPFYLRMAQTAFGAVDRSLLETSRTLGATEAGTFARVAIPVARPGLTAGLALAWGRALGEFGATLMFAGSLQRVTQTVPLAIYDEFASNFSAALALSAILVIVSAAVLIAVRLVAGTAALGSATR